MKTEAGLLEIPSHRAAWRSATYCGRAIRRGLSRLANKRATGRKAPTVLLVLLALPPLLCGQQLNSVTPSVMAAGGPAFTLTVKGSDFVSGAVVRWNGSDRPTTFVDSTRLTAAITVADVSTVGQAQVTVFNFEGAVSGALPFTIYDPAPIWSMFGRDPAHAGNSPVQGPSVPNLVWTYGPFVGIPVVGPDGTIYSHSIGDTFNPVTVAVNLNGTLKWNHTYGSHIAYVTASAVGPDGTVYTLHPTQGVLALDPADGSTRWNFPLRGDTSYGSPIVGKDGTIYVADRVGLSNLTDPGRVYAINPDGTQKWVWDSGTNSAGFESTPALGPNGDVYINHNTRNLVALDSSGQYKWQYGAGQSFNSPCVGPDGTIYIGSSDYYFYALNPDGTLKWRVPVQNWMSHSGCAFSVDGSTIYRGDNGGIFYAIRNTGSVKWTYQAGNTAFASTPAVSANGIVYFANGGTLYGLAESDGTRVWSYPLGGGSNSSPALGPDGRLYATGYNAQSAPLLYAFAPIKADLAVAMTATPSTLPAGSNVTYTIAVTNNGPSKTPGIMLTDVLPGSVTLVSATPQQGNCSGTTTVVCALGGLDDSATTNVTLVVQTQAAGELSNTATVASYAIDEAPGNNSDTKTVTVTNPAPTLSTLDPVSAPVGGSAFTLTLTGTGFVTSSKVMWGATEKAPLTVSSTQITVAVLAADIANSATVPVTVVNPGPGGGTSNALDFSVTTSYTAVIVAGTPQSAHIGGAFSTNLQVKVTNSSGGSNVEGATVTFTAPSSGAGGTFPGGLLSVSVATGPDGIATAPSFTANSTTGTYTVTAATVGADAVSFSLTNTNQAPTTVSVTPASGTALGQTFVAQYADADGHADITFAGLLINSAVNGAGACYVYYQNSLLYLRNDANSGGSGATPGAATSLINSQCTVDVGQSSVVRSGNTVTLTVAITAKPVFTGGTKNLYLYAAGIGGLNSGWVQRGTWAPENTNQAPATVSVTPNSGTGASATFTAVYSDANGGSQINFAGVMINTAVSGTSACYVYYQNGYLWLRNDANSGGSGALPGTVRTVSNSQCSLDIGQSSVVPSGNNLTVTVALTFLSVFTGTKNIYLFAADSGGLNSGWVQRGAWTVNSTNQPPATVSVAPNSGSGGSATFTAVYSDANGGSQISFAGVLIHTAVSGTSACYVYYQNGYLWLRNDAGSGGSGALPGTVRTVSNSQCSLDIGQSSVVPSGNNLTVTVALTFLSAFTGTKNIYLYAADSGGLNSGWVQRGTWTAQSTNQVPATVSVTPSSGTGASAVFTGVYSHGGGAGQLTFAGLLIHTAVSGANACYVYYQNGLLYLRNDANSGGSGGTPGIGGIVSNSQCSLNLAQSSVVPSGNNLSMTVAITFTPAFTGTKNLYMYAADSGGLNSGWAVRGTWTPF